MQVRNLELWLLYACFYPFQLDQVCYQLEQYCKVLVYLPIHHHLSHHLMMNLGPVRRPVILQPHFAVSLRFLHHYLSLHRYDVFLKCILSSIVWDIVQFKILLFRMILGRLYHIQLYMHANFLCMTITHSETFPGQPCPKFIIYMAFYQQIRF